MKHKLGFPAIALTGALLFAACSTGGGAQSAGQSGAASAEPLHGADLADTWATVEEAYVYAFPLVLVDATARNSTNTVTATDTKAPINQMIHASKLADADSKQVVTPNVDTIYTQVFFDLADDAMVYTLPAADRFLSAQIMDAYTNSVAILGSGGDTHGEQSYLIAGPEFDGTVPDGLEVVRVPTDNAWMIVRTEVGGADDLPNVRALQDAMELVPLQSYGREYAPPEGSVDPANDFVPVEHVLSMAPQEFFARANELMAKNPPADADAPIAARMAGIGVGPGLTFDVSVLGEDAGERWTAMLKGLEGRLRGSTSGFTRQMGTWSYYGEPISEFGTEYDYRALIALGGLGANPVSVAVYPQATADSAGEVLDGTKSYILHFDELPPVEDQGFWSITAYGEDKFLIDNEQDRYAVNDRSGLVPNEDGSVDVLVQAEPPEDDAMMANWLPVAPEQFHLYLRVYLPAGEVFDGSWVAPTIAVR